MTNTTDIINIKSAKNFQRILTPILITFCIVGLGCQHFPPSTIDQKIKKVENNLILNWNDPPWKRMNLLDRMTHHQVPGLSLAFINNFQIEWIRTYGVLQKGSNHLVTPDTLFQTCSLGKPVVAAAALHHVEAGKLNLDENVNQRLSSWHVPQNAFTSRAHVTLRRLLSHQAGITLPGVIGYPRRDNLPTLLQMLNGQPPANTPPLHVDFTPGTRYRYSGGGYLIVQQLLMDVTRKPFPDIISETIFQPLQMTDSIFDPLPQSLEPRAAHGHRSHGKSIPSKWFTYPEMGMGPFWSTPSDLARFLREIMLAYHGRSDKILSQTMTREMLTPQINDQGLGPQLGDDGADRFYFSHWGANEGYQAVFVAYPLRGQAAVIMTNSDNGHTLARELLKSISRTYRWTKGFYL